MSNYIKKWIQIFLMVTLLYTPRIILPVKKYLYVPIKGQEIACGFSSNDLGNLENPSPSFDP